MQGLTVDEPTLDEGVGVVTLRAAEHLCGPPGVLQGGLTTAGLELAARAVQEATVGVEPGSARVPAATMVEARLHQPTPVDEDLVAMAVPGGDGSWELRTVTAGRADEADWGDDEAGTDVLAAGIVALGGHGEQPDIGDLVDLALVDRVPLPHPVDAAPHCWVCGRANHRGLHLFPGWLDGASVVEEWTPDERAADDAGRFVDPAVLAAVMDCPTVWAARDHMAAHGFGGALLGGYTVGWFSRLPLGEQVRIVAHLDDGDGRKMRARAAVVGLDGHVYAAASAFQVGVAHMPGATADPMPAFDTVDW